MAKLKQFPKILAAIFSVFLTNSVLANDIESRISNQQGKIGSLKASKKLNGAQTSRADNFTYKITQEEQKMKTRHHGKLTARDKAKLNRQLNRNDRIINREKKKK